MPPRLKPIQIPTGICARCALRLKHRHASRGYHAKVPDRSLISFEGVDIVPFLQGLVTANITKASQIPTQTRSTVPTEALYTAFLNAQGRVLHDVLIYPNRLDGEGDIENKYLVEVDSRSAQSLLKHLKKHKLRSKFKMRLLDSEELETWSRWQGPEGTSDLNLDPSSPAICAVDPRPGLQDRLLIPPNTSLLKRLQDTAATPEEYVFQRMSHGVAEGQNEIIPESALPQESNIDFFGGIDFRKGCYLGQELTIRTHHTGVVRKRIIPVKFTHLGDNQENDTNTMPQPPPSSNISKIGLSKGRSAGKYLSGVGNIGLALCRLEMVSDIQLTDNPTTFDPTQRLKISWEDEVRGEQQELQVEAIIPEWMRMRLKRPSTEQTKETDESDE